MNWRFKVLNPKTRTKDKHLCFIGTVINRCFFFLFTDLIPAMAHKQNFIKIKDYLNNTIGDGKDKHLPNGAVQSVWMTLPPKPKNDYDEVYPNLILGNQ